MSLLSLTALAVSLLTVLILGWQTRLLRKTLEASNYDSLIGNILDTRSSIVDNAMIGKIFEDSPYIQPILSRTGLTVSESFWVLNFLTTWECFYRQRRMGLLGDESWGAYKNSLKVAFATPKLREFWLEYSQYGNYRSDWAEFISKICSGVEPPDPILPRWSRMIRKTT